MLGVVCRNLRTDICNRPFSEPPTRLYGSNDHWHQLADCSWSDVVALFEGAFSLVSVWFQSNKFEVRYLGVRCRHTNRDRVNLARPSVRSSGTIGWPLIALVEGRALRWVGRAIAGRDHLPRADSRWGDAHGPRRCISGKDKNFACHTHRSHFVRNHSPRSRGLHGSRSVRSRDYRGRVAEEKRQPDTSGHRPRIVQCRKFFVDSCAVKPPCDYQRTGSAHAEAMVSVSEALRMKQSAVTTALPTRTSG